MLITEQMNKYTVDPKLYNTDYFMHQEYGGGSGEEFLKGIVAQRFKDALNYAGVRGNMRILDIGCGRGEMAYLCAKEGAQAVGIDYSKDAINLAQSLKNKLHDSVRKKLEFLHLEGFVYPFEDESFDRIFLLDVAEHLSPEELLSCIKEARRLLKRRGQLIIDTSPNRLFNDFAYPLWERPLNKIINIIFKKNLMTRPARTEYDRKVHINELTLFSLRKYLVKAAFKEIEIFMHPRKVTPRKMPGYKNQVLEVLRCAVTCLYPISSISPVNIIFCNDIIARARK